LISYDFIAENYAELEADFQREYGIDLTDALYGERPMGVRRLTALINGLSLGSATLRKANKNWGTVEELLASVAELIDVTNRLLYQANFDTKKTPVWEPLQITRPYQEDDDERASDRRRESAPDEVRSFFMGTISYDPEGDLERQMSD